MAILEDAEEALRLILKAQQDGRIRKSLDVLLMCRAVQGDIDCVLKCVAQAGARPSFLASTRLSSFSFYTLLRDR